MGTVIQTPTAPGKLPELKALGTKELADYVMSLYELHLEYDANTPREFREGLAILRGLQAMSPKILDAVYTSLDKVSKECTDDGLREKYQGAAAFLRINFNLSAPKGEAPKLEQRV